MREVYDELCNAGDMLAEMVGLLLVESEGLAEDQIVAVQEGIIAWHNMRRIAGEAV